jgi:hypothetical protein
VMLGQRGPKGRNAVEVAGHSAADLVFSPASQERLGPARTPAGSDGSLDFRIRLPYR